MPKIEKKPILSYLDFSDKIVLITGAASGIGKAIAYRFAELKANLLLIDINLKSLKMLSSNIRKKHNVEPKVFRIDLSSKEEIEKFWEGLKEIPNVLINNAGIYTFKEFTELDEDFLKKTFSINFESTLWMCQYMIKKRGKKGGVIINMGSIEAVLPFARGMAHYDSSKMAIIALTRALARDYGKFGFRINGIIPGGIETEGVKKLKKETLMKFNVELMKVGYDFSQRLPMKRMGDPDEVARVAVFLASDLASYVNGTFITVDGGFLSS